MRVLLVAPHTDLKFARSERSNWQAARNMQVEEVPSPITLVSVTRALMAERYDGVAILGHGGPDGIPLDDGETLDYDTLAPCIRGRVSWLYLGVCESEALANRLRQAWGIPILCTPGKVYDKVAYSVGTMLAFHLDGGEPFERAAELAAEPSKSRSWKLVKPAMPEVGTPIDGAPFRRTIRAIA